MYENLPDELKKYGLFCAWKLVPRSWSLGDSVNYDELMKDKKTQTKVPLCIATRRFARSNDESTFSSFDLASKSDLAQPILKQDRMIQGLGLGIFRGFSAVDIDHCVDGDGIANPFAKKIIDFFSSYTEYSPSGTGVRIVFKTNIKIDKDKFYANNSKIGLEIYIEGSTSKFVTLTGNLYPGCAGFDVETVDPTPIMALYMKKEEAKPVLSASISLVSPKDVNLSRFIQSDPKLNRLWNAKAPGAGSNESEQDLALCDKLAFYLQRDEGAIDEAFRSSPYYQSKDDAHKDKWEKRKDYREGTLRMAVNGCAEVYSPTKKSEISKETDPISDFGLTDTGNAKLYVALYKDILRYNVDNVCWYVWNDRYWQPDILGQAKELADEMTQSLSNDSRMGTDKQFKQNVDYLLSSRGKENMLKEAQHQPGVPSINADYDRDKYLFNCETGVLDLRDLSIRKPTQDMMLTKFSAIKIDKSEPVLFDKFMKETFCQDQSLIDYVMKIFSICLTGDTSEQKIWFLIGDGSNGKSVLQSVMMSVLGDYSATATRELLIDRKYQNQNITELARLKGKRCVFVSESKPGDALDESSVKDITGGTSVVARFLYKNEFEFTPEFKIFMMSNNEPIIKGTDNGIWRRSKFIRFNHVVPDSEQDLHLIDKLLKEKDRIFWELIRYYLIYKKEGLKEPTCVSADTKSYRTEMDLVQKWIDENCVVGDGEWAYSNVLWTDFDGWLTRRKEYQFSQTLFGRNLGKKFQKARRGSGMVYLGLSLKKTF